MSGRLARVRSRGDDGYAMLTVLVSFLLLTGLVTASLGYALANVPQSRESADTRAALGAAQAGVQDYIQRLNTCPEYWLAPPCATSSPNAALGGWAVLPGTTGTNTAEYTQKVLSTPMQSRGALRLQVTGRVNGEERTVVADLTKAGFLKFLYYSDYETFTPTSAVNFFGTGNFRPSQNRTRGGHDFIRDRWYYLARPSVEQVKAGCEKYHYDGRATFARTVYDYTTGINYEVQFSPGESLPLRGGNLPADPYFTCLDINFTSGDVIRGPLHTNDAMLIGGNATFGDPDTWTSWPSTGVAVPATDPSRLWRGSGTPQQNTPQYANRIEMPPTNGDITRQADPARGGLGCLYTGPTEILFLTGGKMSVRSPYSRQVNPGCSTSSNLNDVNMSSPQIVDGPQNGVIYVQDVPADAGDPNYRPACSGDPLPEYTAIPADVTPYECQRGDTFVKGTVSGRYTVGAFNDINIVGDVVYEGGLDGTNVLGLVANNNVAVFHPVNSGGQNLSVPGEGVGITNIRIDAAMASVLNSFTVQNYASGETLGTLTVNGVIAQKFRGPVGTGGTSPVTGYLKDYNYDRRLPTLPPPSFLPPLNDAWSVVGFSEETTPDDLP